GAGSQTSPAATVAACSVWRSSAPVASTTSPSSRSWNYSASPTLGDWLPWSSPWMTRWQCSVLYERHVHHGGRGRLCLDLGCQGARGLRSRDDRQDQAEDPDR